MTARFAEASMVVRVLVLTLAAALLTSGRASASDVPDAAVVTARNLQAVGPLPPSYRETIATTSTISSAIESIVRRGDDIRITNRTPISLTARGTYHGEHWEQNANGHTILIDPDPNDTARDAITTTVTHVADPIDAIVVLRLNARGAGSRDFYDPTTWLLVRHEYLSAIGTSVTMYDRFQTIGGRRMAMHWHTHDERTRVDTDATVTDFTVGTIAESEVQIPDSRRQLVEFPAGVKRVQLPARFLTNGHIIVPVLLGGRLNDFILDTGSSVIAIDPAIVARLGLPILNRYSNAANAGRIDSGTVILPEMHVGTLTLHDVHANLVPQGYMEDAETKSVGLLGFDFLCELGVSIDYVHHTVTVDTDDAQTLPPRAIVLPIRLGSQVPITTVTVNGAAANRMMIDTGAAGAVMFFDSFARRHPAALVDDHGFGAQSPRLQFSGVGGHIDTKPYAFQSFRIGSVNFKDFIGYVVTSASYEGVGDGTVGPEFLRYFDVRLDYPNGVIVLVPNERVGSAR